MINLKARWGLSLKPRFFILLLALSLIIMPTAQAADDGEDDAPEKAVMHMVFDKIAPLPGAFALSADGRMGAHIGTNGDVVIWDAVTLTQLATMPAGGKKPSAVALNPDGDLVAIGYVDSRVIVRSRLDQKPDREFVGHVAGISALAFSADGQMLASGAEDGTTQLWAVATGRRLRIFDSMFNGQGTAAAIEFSGNGRVLVVAEWHARKYLNP
jgi:WD40 repeat protein